MTERPIVHAPSLEKHPLVPASAWVHGSATLIGDVTLGEDASVWPGAVLRGDRDAIVVGAETNVQDGAVLHCDPGLPLRIGARVTVGHRAVLHGCTVEDGALIGIGAIVLNGAVVGAGSLVAAGAVVSEGMEIPPDSLVVGVPAKVLRPLSEAQRARVAKGYVTYVGLKELHRGRV
ncbi:MAG: gamma carbonic anhydrase family protein [Gemmatimonadaceae bacterium]|nr:gamma carbonic anhydrase family protein [Gemmatimonadaceae bacterium]MCW5826154.1 gamma carbonic anhydrase family protein [Gemmatimonadaceae bacterium]